MTTNTVDAPPTAQGLATAELSDSTYFTSSA
jgi:hypothetical protein